MKTKSGLLIITIALIAFALGGLVWADTNGIWHRAQDIRGGIFGDDEQPATTEYTFINPVEFNQTVTANNGIEVNVIKSNTPNGNVVIQLG